jgi:hypothetical protein
MLDLERQLLAVHPPVSIKEQFPCQTQPIARKSLNMDIRMGKLRDSGVHEHIQNWTDQCRTLAGGFPMVVKKHQVPQEDFLFVGVLVECAPGQVLSLGYMAEFSDPGSGFRTLFLKNFGTQLSFDMMTLGVSTKEEDLKSAGGFLQ